MIIISMSLRDAAPRERLVWNGRLAQLGEHLPYKHGVTGSSPVVPTTLKNAQHYVLCFFYVSGNNIGLE